MKRLALLTILMFTAFLAMGQGSSQYQRHGKKTSAEIAAIDVSNTNYVYTATDITLGIEVINWSDGNGWVPRTGTGGGTYTAGNGLNLNGNQFSLDSTRVILIDVNSPLTGPAKFAFGTNAALDALATPVDYDRYEFAIDGVIAGAGVTDHGLLNGLLDDDHTQYHTDARAATWLSALYPNLDTDSTDDGDMSKAVFDADDNGTVDDSEALNGAISTTTATANTIVKRDALGNINTQDDIYDITDWNTNGEVPNKNSLRDYFAQFDTDGNGIPDVVEGDFAHLNAAVNLWTGNQTIDDGNSVSFGTDSDFGFYHTGGLNFLSIASGGALRVQYLGTQYFQISSSISPINGGLIYNTDDPFDPTSWNGSSIVTTKNAVRDQFVLMDSDSDGLVDNVEDGAITETKISSTFYEEGTFTPTLYGDTSNTFTYVQTADFTRVGNKVTVRFEIANINGSCVGFMRIGGLPFNAADDHVVGGVFMYGISQNFYSVVGSLTGGGNIITLNYQGAFDGSINEGFQDVSFSNGSIFITTTYLTN